MSPRGHRVVYGQGAQPLRFMPVDSLGAVAPVASATYQIEDLRLSETDAGRFVVAESAATVDTVNTTTTAAAGRGSADPFTIALTSVVGVVVGRSYLLESASGIREVVTVALVGPSFVRTRAEVSNGFAAGSSVVGVEISGTFPADEADSETSWDDGAGPYLVTWIYSHGDESQRLRVPMFVERAADQCPIDQRDLENAEPLVASLSGGRTPPAQYIAAGWWKFKVACVKAKLDLSRVHVGEVGRSAIAHWAVCAMLRSHDLEKYGDLALMHENNAQGDFDALIVGNTPGDVVKVDSENTSPSGRRDDYSPRFLAR